MPETILVTSLKFWVAVATTASFVLSDGAEGCIRTSATSTPSTSSSSVTTAATTAATTIALDCAQCSQAQVAEGMSITGVMIASENLGVDANGCLTLSFTCNAPAGTTDVFFSYDDYTYQGPSGTGTATATLTCLRSGYWYDATLPAIPGMPINPDINDVECDAL